MFVKSHDFLHSKVIQLNFITSDCREYLFKKNVMDKMMIYDLKAFLENPAFQSNFRTRPVPSQFTKKQEKPVPQKILSSAIYRIEKEKLELGLQYF